jgi:hypothetical protein
MMPQDRSEWAISWAADASSTIDWYMFGSLSVALIGFYW